MSAATDQLRRRGRITRVLCLIAGAIAGVLLVLPFHEIFAGLGLACGRYTHISVRRALDFNGVGPAVEIGIVLGLLFGTIGYRVLVRRLVPGWIADISRHTGESPETLRHFTDAVL